MYSEKKPLIALVVSMWLSAYLILFGLETSALIYKGDWLTPLATVVTFLLFNVLFKELLQREAYFRPKVVIGGKRRHSSLIPAVRPVAEYVHQRAMELGIKEEVKVYYRRGTWNVVEAYAFTIGSNHGIVLGAGTQSLFLSKNQEQRAQFKVLLDHELGHLYNRDTSLLYMARGIILTSVILLPFKGLADFIYYQELIKPLLDRLPKVMESFSVIPGLSLANEKHTVISYVIVTFSGLFLLRFFYIAVVRGREFAADRFALRHSNDPDLFAGRVERLLGCTASKAAPPHGFNSRSKWHPKHEKRLLNLRGETISDRPEALAFAVLVISLFLFRFFFGIETNRGADPHMRHLVPLSSLFMLIVAFLTDCHIALPGYTTKKKCLESTRLFFSMLAISIPYSILFYKMGRFLAQERDDFNAYWMNSVFAHSEESFMLLTQRIVPDLNRDIYDIQLFEQAILFGSAPLVILCFAFASVFLGRLYPDYSKTVYHHGASLIVSTCLALLILLGISKMIEPMVHTLRKDSLIRVFMKADPNLLPARSNITPMELESGVNIEEAHHSGVSLDQVDGDTGHQSDINPAAVELEEPTEDTWYQSGIGLTEILSGVPLKEVGDENPGAIHTVDSAPVEDHVSPLEELTDAEIDWLYELVVLAEKFDANPDDPEVLAQVYLKLTQVQITIRLHDNRPFSPPISFLFLWHSSMEDIVL